MTSFSSQGTDKASQRMTHFQRDCLAALNKFPNGHASASDISRVLKRGPGWHLAVTSAMRSLLKRDNHGHPDVSDWVVRLAPRDQWSRATWCIGKRAVAFLSEANLKEGT